MIAAFKKIWQFAGEETANINKSVVVSFCSAVLQMFQVGAIYFVVLALTGGGHSASTAWLALVFALISIFGGAVASSQSKLLQTHAGYFMAANRRISIADRLKSVQMGYFNANSLGQLSGVCTTVVSGIESIVPMVLVNILSGLITTAVFMVLIFVFDWRVGLIVAAGIAAYLCVVSAMEKKSVAVAQEAQRTQTALIEAVLETVQGMSVIKSFNLTGKGDKKLQTALEANRQSSLHAEQLMTPYTAMQEFVLQLANVGMMLAAIVLWSSGGMSLANALMMIVIPDISGSIISRTMISSSFSRNIFSASLPVKAEKRVCPASFIYAHIALLVP